MPSRCDVSVTVGEFGCHGRVCMAKSTESGAANDSNSTPTQTTVSAAGVDESDEGDFLTSAVTVGAIMVGAALIEATLIPGIIVGAAAVLAPKYLPQIGAGLQPMLKYAIRGVY